MINTKKMIFGLDSFGDIPTDDEGNVYTQAHAIRQVIREAKLADDLGIDVIALGEHHREEYAISSPDMVLAAIATITKKIKLATGVTVLSSDDPVRVYERFATLEAISNGRAEAVLGRGSFTESFPLFGYDLQDYDLLFEEKLNLYSKLLEEKPVTWEGKTRASLKDANVFPKTENGNIATRIAVGGSPESVVRTARYGFPLTLAIIGGSPERFKPYIELYKRAADKFENPAFPIAVHSHGMIADTDEEAIELAWNHIRKSFVKIGNDRGWAPMSREQFESEVQNGSFYVGSSETVAKRLARMIKTLGIKRFELVYGAGGLSASAREHMIELYATKVIPRVRELLSEA